MEDAENSLPPSKKRSAGRELTQDTPIDDDEEDTSELETGTFKKASDEVLATRRIVKVRRQPQTSSAPSSNPFAAIRLVTPTESSANPSEAMPTNQAQLASENTTADDTNGITKDSEKAEDGNTEQSETKDSEKSKGEVEDKSAEESTEKENTAEKESGTEKSEVDKEQSNDENSNKNEDKHVADKGSAGEVDKEKIEHESVTENNDKKENADKVESEEPSAEGSPLKSFQQLSSSQNAFTGLAGTGFSSSSFSFGSISNDASALGNTSGSNFGTKNDKPFGLGLSNNGISLFGAAGSSAASKSEGSGFSTMPEVVVETGEENERAVFNADSILFEYVDGSWKERGKGELKINVTTIGSDKARLLMRSRGNYRLILNARLYPDMKLTNMEKKGVTFACINSATEGKNGLSTFALKFKDGSIVEEFKAAIMAHKGEASRGLKTPENSP